MPGTMLSTWHRRDDKDLGYRQLIVYIRKELYTKQYMKCHKRIMGTLQGKRFVTYRFWDLRQLQGGEMAYKMSWGYILDLVRQSWAGKKIKGVKIIMNILSFTEQPRKAPAMVLWLYRQTRVLLFVNLCLICYLCIRYNLYHSCHMCGSDHFQSFYYGI